MEAFFQVPKYAKFMKELLTNNCKLEEASTVSLDESCSDILQSKLPRKIKDPGWLVVECKIRDFGESINIMPYTLFLKLGLQELEPT